MQLQHAGRLGIALFAFFCSTGWATGTLESISPAQPEAYQTFTITIKHIESPESPNPGIVGVRVEAGTVTLDDTFARPYFITSEERFKTATITGLPAGTYTLKERILSPESIGLLGEFTVTPAPPAQPVFALYHAGIDHYFLTASPAQRDFLLEVDLVWGIVDERQIDLDWRVVDEGFKAWPASGPAPAAAKPVCRLYSPLVNTHFYSANAATCDSLKQQTGVWIDEGIAFRALVPADGTCPSGTLPVWRLYNNRFAQLDSNHRYLISQDTYRNMIANGWIGEGVAFCSPE